MKKQLVIVGIIVILICVGLNGCVGETSIADIQAHSNNYINKTVTIRGQYSGGGSLYYIMDTKAGVSMIQAIDSNNIVKPTPVVSGSEYKFTGIVRYGSPMSYYPTSLYLEVTKIETT